MPKRPIIVGSGGGMGRRYSAILKYLRVPFLGVDANDAWPEKEAFDSVLICTPTALHIEHVREFFGHGVPILCEKPLATNISDVIALCDDAESQKVKIRCVNQYAQLVPDGAVGETKYDYWRSGSDGLAYDCISILALANGPVTLAAESPIWSCQINGFVLNLADMDLAYIRMIEGWLSGDVDGLDYIRRAHQKVEKYLCSRS